MCSQLTSFGHLSYYHLSNPELGKSGFRYLRNHFMICSKFNISAFIWWVNHQNWTIWTRNFSRFWTVFAVFGPKFAENVFCLFLDVFLKYYGERYTDKQILKWFNIIKTNHIIIHLPNKIIANAFILLLLLLLLLLS